MFTFGLENPLSINLFMFSYPAPAIMSLFPSKDNECAGATNPGKSNESNDVNMKSKKFV